MGLKRKLSVGCSEKILDQENVSCSTPEININIPFFFLGISFFFKKEGEMEKSHQLCFYVTFGLVPFYINDCISGIDFS